MLETPLFTKNKPFMKKLIGILSILAISSMVEASPPKLEQEQTKMSISDLLEGNLSLEAIKVVPGYALDNCQVFEVPVNKIGFPTVGEAIVTGLKSPVMAVANAPPLVYR